MSSWSERLPPPHSLNRLWVVPPAVHAEVAAAALLATAALLPVLAYAGAYAAAAALATAHCPNSCYVYSYLSTARDADYLLDADCVFG